jgi:hypothetical protein
MFIVIGLSNEDNAWISKGEITNAYDAYDAYEILNGKPGGEKTSL